MTTLQGSIGTDGALVAIWLTLAHANIQNLRQAGMPLPAPLALHALLDPGAEATCIDAKSLRPLVNLGLAPSRIIMTNSPALGGSTVTTEYTIGLTIVHPSGNPSANLVLRNHPVVELALGTLGYDALIGRDILDRCLLIYDGPGKSFTLAY